MEDINNTSSSDSSLTQSEVLPAAGLKTRFNYLNTENNDTPEEIAARRFPKLELITSRVFNHYVWHPGIRQWSCIHCHKLYDHNMAGSSSTLVKHLRRTHQISVERNKNSLSKKNNTTVMDSYNSMPQNKMKHFAKELQKSPVTKETFQDLLLDLVIRQNLPLSIVDSLQFRTLISTCLQGNRPNMDSLLPDHVMMQAQITDVFTDMQNALKEELRKAPGKISFTITELTSNCRVPYHWVVVASWIDENWKLQTCVLDLAKLKNFGSGEDIAGAFSKTLGDFELWEKLLAVTTENASNMDIFFEEMDDNCQWFNFSNYRVRCLAQVINRTCNAIISSFCTTTSSPYCDVGKDNHDSVYRNLDKVSDGTFPTTTNIIKKLRFVVAAISDCNSREDMLKEFCCKLKVEYKRLTMDLCINSSNDTTDDNSSSISCCSGWNSTLRMLEGIVGLKAAFIATVDHLPELKNYRIDKREWDKIEKLIEILEPFKETATILTMSDNPSVTISETTATYQFLFLHLIQYMEQKPVRSSRFRKLTTTNINDNDDGWITRAVESGMSQLQKYYSTTTTSNNCGLVSFVASVIDPRCKLQYFKSIGWDKKRIDLAKQAMMRLWSETYKPLQTRPPEKINDKTNCTSSSSRMNDDELHRFWTEPIVNPILVIQQQQQTNTHGALGWWKVHEDEFPNLSKMARDFLAISACGYSVKDFLVTTNNNSSIPYLLFSKTRHVNEDTLRMCMCIKSWLKRKKSSDGLQEVVTKASDKQVLDDDEYDSETEEEED